jgi:hypothetical protein
MIHPSALLGTAAANPVVAVCIANGTAQTNDAVFIAAEKGQRDRATTTKNVTKVTTDVPSGGGTFVGFAMSTIRTNTPADKRQLSVGVAGAFTTHADPDDIRRLQPGDYLAMNAPSTARIADHDAAFRPPKYTVAGPDQHAVLRFLRQETASTMRVLITKARRFTDIVYPNRGFNPRPAWVHARLDYWPGRTTHGIHSMDILTRDTTANLAAPNGTQAQTQTTALNTQDIAMLYKKQMGWRVFMKLKDWTPAELSYGPGLLDKDGYRTGVFTMTSDALTARMGGNRVPFLLMVDNRNAVRLVTAESAVRGQPVLLAEQQQGRPYTLFRNTGRGAFAAGAAEYNQGGAARVAHGPLPAAVVARTEHENWTKESWDIREAYLDMCLGVIPAAGGPIPPIASLTGIWDSLTNAEDAAVAGANAWAAAHALPAGERYPSRAANMVVTPLYQAWDALIDRFEQTVSGSQLPIEILPFIQLLRDLFYVHTDGHGVQSWHLSVRPLQPKFATQITAGINTSPFEGLEDIIRGVDGDKGTFYPEIPPVGIPTGTSSIAWDNRPGLVDVGQEYRATVMPLDTTPPMAANLRVPSQHYRIWGLGGQWAQTDRNPNRMLKDIPASLGWRVDPGYYPSIRQAGATPACAGWVNEWAKMEYVEKPTRDAWRHADGAAIQRNYRSHAPLLRGDVSRPIADTAGDGWTATAAMGGGAPAAAGNL